MLGVEAASGSYLVGSQEGMFDTANIRRGLNESPFEGGFLAEVKLGHFDYVSKGASASMRALQVVHASIRVPDAHGNYQVPRRTMLSEFDVSEHGLTPGCPICKWLTHKVGNLTNNPEDRRRRIEERSLAAFPLSLIAMSSTGPETSDSYLRKWG